MVITGLLYGQSEMKQVSVHMTGTGYCAHDFSNDDGKVLVMTVMADVTNNEVTVSTLH